MNSKTKMKEVLKRVPPIGYLADKRRRWKRRRLKNELGAYGMDMLSNTLEHLNEAGIEAFAAFGTLLGMVREGGIISHDLDLDTAFVVRNAEDWQLVESTLNEAGYEKCREYAMGGIVTEQAYSCHHFHCDVFGLFQQEGDTCRAYAYFERYGCVDPNKSERPVWYIDFPMPKDIYITEDQGRSIWIPRNSVELLEACYGDWKMPNPAYDHTDYWARLESAKGERTFFKK